MITYEVDQPTPVLQTSESEFFLYEPVFYFLKQCESIAQSAVEFQYEKKQRVYEKNIQILEDRTSLII